MYADHIFIHSILRNKRRIFLSELNQSVRGGRPRTAGLKVHSLLPARLDEVIIFPLLIDSMIIAHNTANRQIQQLSDNNNNSSSSSTSYLDQIMSITAVDILSSNLICKIDLNPEILRCVDSPLIIHLLPSNKNFFG